VGRKTQIAASRERGGGPTVRPQKTPREDQAGRECLSRFKKNVAGPLAAGILELSAEAHTPAMAIRRKIAEANYFHASRISNTELRNFFSRPQTSDSS